MFIFEDFRLTLVKKNRQNGELRKRVSIYIVGKSRALIAWKKTNERTSLVNSFCRQRTGLEVLIKVASKSDIDGKESGLGQE